MVDREVMRTDITSLAIPCNEIAEEIGVHPSTVSRAVASKFAHTPQGVFELRYFFSGDYNRDEGAVYYNWQNKLATRANIRLWHR